MTRTARASFPRAVIRDRSESKSGFDKSVRKNGAGAHSWGSLADDKLLDFAAMDEQEFEYEEEVDSSSNSSHSEPLEEKKPGLQRTNSVVTNDELETARNFRKNVLKTANLDLSAIARTSYAVAASPKNAVAITSDAQI
ncbi:hypothetical protein D9615_003150 [Tricholomella constricta]|uniref:Hyaluronan/mRNA-binding protein domain-containing protein n=1 Tax=Tricholomella constricta TaxID=117010 RepID=A0A8H5HIZ6_9AGAR|nr:hypothetical protein D9615_003150 [Tricholomella constricta]